MRSGRYILKGKEPIPCEDLKEWGEAMEIKNRRVAFTVIGGINVSTVFLGLDHNWMGGRPLLFETMVFGGPHDQEWMDRYSTWDEAEAGHKAMVEKVRNEKIQDIVTDFKEETKGN